MCRECTVEPVPVIARSAASYSHPLIRPILVLKYRPSRELALMLAGMLQATFEREGWIVDVIVPVPLSCSRERRRGYNQAELISRQLAVLIGVDHQPALLRRVRRTQSQVGLAPHERRANVINAFEAQPEVNGLRILIVDDLYTTGATMRACGMALLDKGAAQVFGLTVARA